MYICMFNLKMEPFAFITAFKRRHRMHDSIKFRRYVVQLSSNSLFQLLHCADTEPIELTEKFLPNMINILRSGACDGV